MPRVDKAGLARRKERQFLTRIAEIERTSPALAERMCSVPRGASVRVNRLSELPPEEIVAAARGEGFELEPIDWCPDAYHLNGSKSALAESDLFREGHVYIQTASSLLPALALDPRPGERILDAAAAPGGKAAHIASITRGDAELWLNDPIDARVDRLEEVMRVQRVSYARLTRVPGQYLDKEIEERFDRVLLDAQCSGEGRIDLSHPGALRFWSENRIVKYGYLQRRMLVAAFRLLKPGGVLVYSTCTYAPEENEAAIDHLLRHHPAASERIGVALPGDHSPLAAWRGRQFDPGVANAWRVRPTERLEGFFVARIRRAAS